MWTSYRLDDRERLRSFLETDRPYAAYAIADLEPGPFALCTWGGAECAGSLRALVLHYRGLAPNPLLLMGEVDGVAAAPSLGGGRNPPASDEESLRVTVPWHVLLISFATRFAKRIQSFSDTPSK